MLRGIFKKTLGFSAIMAVALTLLIVDTESPSFISEAQACDQELASACYWTCALACVSGYVTECPQPWQNGDCNCDVYCPNYCAILAGCT
jgi:hypothetical protein